ncbi:hypothetical protein ANO11243_091510 [Dothideomycetidae sp. 11243]|nr:hypothetical protein ANO11243_091510 [fungal sp. No.11243]
MAKFRLARASAADLPEIVDLLFRVFTDETNHDLCMGLDTPEGHSNLSKVLAQIMRTNPGDYWIKILDESTGRIIAATNYRIHLAVVPEQSSEYNHNLTWLQDRPETMQTMLRLLEEGEAWTTKNLVEPYIPSEEGTKFYQTHGFVALEPFKHVMFMRREAAAVLDH